MGWRFSWLRTWQEVWGGDNLARWQSAYTPGAGAHATPFMHPDFVRAWINSVGGETRYRPFFLDAQHVGGQRVLWLFVATRGRWRDGLVRQCVPVGSAVEPFGSRSQLAGYFEPIVTGTMPASGPILAPGFWEAFVAALREREADWFDVCTIARFRTALLGTPPGCEPYTAAPFLRLEGYGGMEDYIASRRPKVRSSMRRRLRRIEEAGRAELHVHDPRDVEGICAWLPRLAAERERRHGVRSIPGDFARRLVTASRDKRLVHGSTLRLDGREISWKLGYCHDGVYYGYYRGFDADHAALAPGQVHFHLLLRSLFAEGVRLVDFGVGTQDYKYEWTDGEDWEMASLTLHSRAPASVARRSMASTVQRMRMLSRALPSRGAAAKPRPDRLPVPAGTQD